MKLYTIALTPMDPLLFVYSVEETCSLHRRDLLVVGASCCLTICATESLVLVLINGLILPNPLLFTESAAMNIDSIACLEQGHEE